MADRYRELFAALDASIAAQDDALVAMGEALAAMRRTNEHLRRVNQAAVEASTEHEDLRETVARLEALVLDLIRRQNGGSR
jgi:hypothetical protein